MLLICFLTFCMIICSAFTFFANAVVAEENDIVIETTVNLGNENELQPMMANMCYDYNTVDDCMRDISSQYGFTYSL